MPSILSLRVPRSVLLTLWCPKSEPLRGAKTDQQPRGFAGLKKTKKFCRRSGASGRWGVIMRVRKPPHPQKTKLKKFGGWGRNRDELTIFIFFLKFIAGSRLVIGCRLDPRNEKTRLSAGSSEGLGATNTSIFVVTGLREPCHQRLLPQCSSNPEHLSSTIPPQKPVAARVVWVVGLSDDSAQQGEKALYWGICRKRAPNE